MHKDKVYNTNIPTNIANLHVSTQRALLIAIHPTKIKNCNGEIYLEVQNSITPHMLAMNTAAATKLTDNTNIGDQTIAREEAFDAH